MSLKDVPSHIPPESILSVGMLAAIDFLHSQIDAALLLDTKSAVDLSSARTDGRQVKLVLDYSEDRIGKQRSVHKSVIDFLQKTFPEHPVILSELTIVFDPAQPIKGQTRFGFNVEVNRRVDSISENNFYHRISIDSLGIHFATTENADIIINGTDIKLFEEILHPLFGEPLIAGIGTMVLYSQRDPTPNSPFPKRVFIFSNHRK